MDQQEQLMAMLKHIEDIHNQTQKLLEKIHKEVGELNQKINTDAKKIHEQRSDYMKINPIRDITIFAILASLFS